MFIHCSGIASRATGTRKRTAATAVFVRPFANEYCIYFWWIKPTVQPLNALRGLDTGFKSRAQQKLGSKGRKCPTWTLRSQGIRITSLQWMVRGLQTGLVVSYLVSSLRALASRHCSKQSLRQKAKLPLSIAYGVWSKGTLQPGLAQTCRMMPPRWREERR